MLAEIFLVFLAFAIHAGWPVPDVNEAHYLGKARHFWDPTFAAGDFFLESADAHAVFYWTIGWLTRWLPLPAAAWGGRLITWWLLAWAWRRLSAAIAPTPWLAVLSAGLLVALSEHCQMAGEWVVGGVEAKGFAYVLVLLALEALVRGRWAVSLWLLGAASSLHVLVGGWASVAVGLTWIAVGNGCRPPWREAALGVAGGLLLALPGLVAALGLNADATAETVRQANEIYVFQRLRHHLVPQTFEAPSVQRHLLLVAVFLLLAARTPCDAGNRRLRWTVCGALGISLVGYAFSLVTDHDPGLSAAVLRYYWFRLGDAFLPLGTALLGVALLSSLRGRRLPAAGFWLCVVVAVAGLNLVDQGLSRITPQLPRGDLPNKVANYQDWRAACEWIAASAEIPPDARFLTPRMAQTFKWHAGRAEVVNWKDVPQDAAGIVEWWRRVQDIHWSGSSPEYPDGRWRSSLTELSSDELRRLATTYQAGYLLTETWPALDLPRVYGNDTYTVYRLEM